MLAALRTPALARAFSASARTNIAKMIIVGRLAADPEPYTTSNGQEIIRYAVGSSYKSNGEDKVSWFKIAAFEDHSKPYLKTLTKGYAQTQSPARPRAPH